MRTTRFTMVIIFTMMSLTMYVFGAHGKCIDECREKCEATIDEKFRWGEEYLNRSTKASTDYLKLKIQQKEKCYGTCDEGCPQNIKKDTADTDSKVKKEPQK